MKTKKLFYICEFLLAIFIINTFIFVEKIEESQSATGPYKRIQIEKRYTWNLADIYSSKEDWEKDFKKISATLSDIEYYKGKLNSVKNIRRCLQLNEQMLQSLEKLYAYAHLKSDLNQADSLASEMTSKCQALIAAAMAKTAFIQPELLAKPPKTLAAYGQAKELKEYQNLFDDILKQQPHTLSTTEEQLLASTAEIAAAPKNIYDKLTVADMVFPVLTDPSGKLMQVTAAGYEALLTNKNRAFRKRGYEAIMEAYANKKNSLAAILNAQVKQDIFYARSRKFPSALEATLFTENIKPEIYNNLITTVNKHIYSLQRYITIRKKVLGLEKVHDYDLYVPLTASLNAKISYPEAQKLLLKGLKPLGKAYLSDMQVAFNERWLDVYETENKYSGNYNLGLYGVHPYVLLNYNNNFGSAMTLAHEMGHAMHSYYTNQTQSYFNSQTPIFTAEVASTVNEILLLNYLIENAKSQEEKVFLLEKSIENIRASIFTQTMYSEFEQAIHERVEAGNALSPETLDTLWLTVWKKYLGPSYIADKLSNIGWARVPHFYMNYYVYKYATAMAAAQSVVEGLKKEGQPAVGRYLEFLKAGSSDTPITLLKKVGVDMTKPEPLDKVLLEFDRQVSELERIKNASR